ncbi:hypothetical protein LOAG_00878 [Loa loa]|uniref:Uncharacterized protein n=1 Tax=Loa loa TaxID=7209 RepID=A0A1S0UA86_LOALO|nr:hypothetical protein LOAG_00878 [Loa loa]EFO27609.1 hypothetical protein LOAG_00878 [Loa loa]
MKRIEREEKAGKGKEIRQHNFNRSPFTSYRADMRCSFPFFPSLGEIYYGISGNDCCQDINPIQFTLAKRTTHICTTLTSTFHSTTDPCVLLHGHLLSREEACMPL